MTGACVHTVSGMGTVITCEVVGHDATEAERSERHARVARAAQWFRDIEAACTRFDADSEICRLARDVGSPVRVSSVVFQAVRFALAVAEDTDGAFDPTLGRGLDGGRASYRDVVVDGDQQTLMLRRPLVLDLGAVAKGLAIDMAARELARCENFAIDAGGDLYLGGTNAEGTAWSVGIRHPRQHDATSECLVVSNAAVCTSGDYERNDDVTEGHHILTPRIGRSAPDLASVTVVASSAMVADALGTAAFVLGPVDGLALLERHGVDGLFITPRLERIETAGFSRHLRHHTVGS